MVKSLPGRRSWQTPYSTRVESITNYQHTSAVADDLLVEDLAFEPGKLNDNELMRIREIALAEPLLINRLISPIAHVTGVNINIELPGVDPISENPEVVNFIRELREEFRAKYPSIEVRLTGIVMMNQAFPEASQYDMSTLFPIMLLIFVVVLYLWVRGLSGTVATFIIIIFSIVGAMGLAGWSGIWCLRQTDWGFVATVVHPRFSAGLCNLPSEYRQSRTAYRVLSRTSDPI